MKPIHIDPAISGRLRELVRSKYPTRGRFGVLENVSAIKASRWKNFFYNKQEATQEMLDFWFNQYRNDIDWILTGILPPEQDDFPFAAIVPKRWEGQTVSDRLNWVISEWAAPKGESLFEYLEEKTNHRIPATEWAEVILKRAEPTLSMIQLVCTYRPMFTEWIIRGMVENVTQIDPTNIESVNKYKLEQKAKFEEILKHFNESKNDPNSN